MFVMWIYDFVYLEKTEKLPFTLLLSTAITLLYFLSVIQFVLNKIEKEFYSLVGWEKQNCGGA